MAERQVPEHRRATIRKSIVRVLTQHTSAQVPVYRTEARDRVFTNRISPWFHGELPAIGVYTIEESSAVRVSAPLIYYRRPEIAVEACVELSEGCDDLLDKMAAQIELAMSEAGHYLKDPVSGNELLDDRKILKSTEMGIAGNGERQVGKVVLRYEMPYESYDPIPIETGLNNFVTGNVQYEVSGTNQSREAVDRFTTGQPPTPQ